MSKERFILKFFERTGLVVDVRSNGTPVNWPINFPVDYEYGNLTYLNNVLFRDQNVDIDFYELKKVENSNKIHLNTIINRQVVPGCVIGVMKNSVREYRLMLDDGQQRQDINSNAVIINEKQNIINQLKRRLENIRKNVDDSTVKQSQIVRNDNLDVLRELVDDPSKQPVDIPARAMIALNKILEDLDESEASVSSEDVLIALVCGVVQAVNAFEYERAKNINNNSKSL